MSVKIYSFGGALEVTGSKHVIDTGKSKVMIDCGAFQGKRQEADFKNRNWDFNPEDFSAVVLTHAHFDHCGMIPMLAKKGYNGNIYATSATRDLANLIMLDSAKIQSLDEQFLSKQAQKRGEKFQWSPLYDERDVINVIKQFVTVAYKRPIRITDDIELTLYDAGHILGSSIACFNIKDENNKILKITFSGDLGRKNKPITCDPDQVPDCDWLVMEGTYGDKLHEQSDDILKKLGEIINRTINRNGKIIIPAFAIERTQDLIYFIHLLVDQKVIPEIPVYVDSPMALNATSIFKLHPECYDEETNQAFQVHHKNPFGFNSLQYIESGTQSKELNNLNKPAIIISSSGMCEAGRIQHHLLHNLSNPNNTILLVGFMAQDTLGKKIKDRLPEVKIFDTYVQLRAEVAEINALSAHADYNEIGAYVSQLDLKRLKKIFLVHGEPAALGHLKGYLSDLGVKQIEIIEYKKTYDIDY